MKTYNLGEGMFWVRRSAEDCYCALGILMTERGYEKPDLLTRGWEIVHHDLIEDVAKMADYIRSQVPAEECEREHVDQVYMVNDARVLDAARHAGCPKFASDIIKGALRAAGIEVELIDRRRR